VATGGRVDRFNKRFSVPGAKTYPPVKKRYKKTQPKLGFSCRRTRRFRCLLILFFSAWQFYTGKQREVATGGRVDRFNKRFSVPGAKK
jgi:ribosomal protein L31